MTPSPLPPSDVQQIRLDRAALAIAQTFLEAAYAGRIARLTAKLPVPCAADFRAEIDAIPEAAYSFARALERARSKVTP